MPDVNTPADLLLLAGTSSFFPAILSYVRSCTPGSLPLDPVIFQAILLCVISGDKHLILHTPEEDIGLVARLSVWTLSSIFGLPTHRLKVRPRPGQSTRSINAETPHDSFQFLRSLLLHSNHDEPIATASKCNLSSSHERTYSRPRPRSANLKASPYARSASFPNNLPSATTSPSSGPSDPFADQQSQGYTSASASDHPQSSSATPKSPRPIHHAHTEPTPLRQIATQLEFPHALVLSGLENLSVIDQRLLAQVLTEKRIVLDPHIPEHVQHRDTKADFSNGKNTALDGSVFFGDFDGVWNAPEEFITIYVCPWNARERPNIHKSLLDKFAMSTTVLIRQSIRQALRALPFSSHPPLHSQFKSYSYSNPGTPSPFTTSPLPQSQTPPFLTHPLPSPHHLNPRRTSQLAHPINVVIEIISRDLLRSLRLACPRVYFAPVLSLYLSDLFSAARHHSQLEGRLLTARAMKDAEDLTRAGRVLGIDPTGGELLRQPSDSKHLLQYDNEDQRSFLGYDEIPGDIGSGSALISASRDAVYLTPADQSGVSLATQDKGERLHVSEADIARIIPRVITHRLRVRDNPEEEVLGSAVFGATFGEAKGRGDEEDDYDRDMRSTVKDILISILAEV